MLKGHAELYVVRKGDKMCVCVFVREKRREREVRWEGEGGRKRKKWGDAVCVLCACVCVCVGWRAVGSEGGQAQSVLITATVGGG